MQLVDLFELKTDPCGEEIVEHRLTVDAPGKRHSLPHLDRFGAFRRRDASALHRRRRDIALRVDVELVDPDPDLLDVRVLAKDVDPAFSLDLLPGTVLVPPDAKRPPILRIPPGRREHLPLDELHRARKHRAGVVVGRQECAPRHVMSPGLLDDDWVDIDGSDA